MSVQNFARQLCPAEHESNDSCEMERAIASPRVGGLCAKSVTLPRGTTVSRATSSGPSSYEGFSRAHCTHPPRAPFSFRTASDASASRSGRESGSGRPAHGDTCELLLASAMFGPNSVGRTIMTRVAHDNVEGDEMLILLFTEIFTGLCARSLAGGGGSRVGDLIFESPFV